MASPRKPVITSDDKTRFWQARSPYLCLSDDASSSSQWSGSQGSPANSDTSDLSWSTSSSSPSPLSRTNRAHGRPRGSSIEGDLSNDLNESDSFESPMVSSFRPTMTSIRPRRSNGRYETKYEETVGSPTPEPMTPKKRKVTREVLTTSPKRRNLAKTTYGSPVKLTLPLQIINAQSKASETNFTDVFSSGTPALESSSPTSSAQSELRPKVTSEPTSLGKFAKLPKEIRQIIYGYVLNIETPVTVKECCCSPSSTKRERDACRKHGKAARRKSGKLLKSNNEGCEMDGRYSILTLSREIHKEASWMLYNHGSLMIKAGEHMTRYINDKPAKNVRNLQKLPMNPHAYMMWMSAARFRNVDIQIPAAVLKHGDPCDYTAHVSGAVSLLLKARTLRPNKSTSTKPREVTIHLGELYKTVAFNANTHPDEYAEWALSHYPYETPEADNVCDTTNNNIERMIEIISRHRGDSKWTVSVAATFDTEGICVDAQGQEIESASWLYGLMDHCYKYDLGFQTI